MKKLLLTISIITLGVHMSSAQMAFGFSFKESFFRFIGITPKSAVVEVKATSTIITPDITIEPVEQKGDNQQDAPKDDTTKVDTKTPEIKSTDRTVTFVAIEPCAVAVELGTKKEETETQIKKQITDKEKVIAVLEKVASNTDATSSEKINNAIDTLEVKVADVVGVENEIIEIVDDTLPVSCDVEQVEAVDVSLEKIKALDVKVAEKSEAVNTLIKVEIKAMLQKIAE